MILSISALHSVPTVTDSIGDMAGIFPRFADLSSSESGTEEEGDLALLLEP